MTNPISRGRCIGASRWWSVTTERTRSTIHWLGLSRWRPMYWLRFFRHIQWNLSNMASLFNTFGIDWLLSVARKGRKFSNIRKFCCDFQPKSGSIEMIQCIYHTHSPIFSRFYQKLIYYTELTWLKIKKYYAAYQLIEKYSKKVHLKLDSRVRIFFSCDPYKWRDLITRSSSAVHVIPTDMRF